MIKGESTTVFSTVLVENVQHLLQGIELMARLTESLYRDNEGLSFNAGVGVHFRHILDYYSCFLAGMNGKIDYDDRERDGCTAWDRGQAIARIRKVIVELNSLHDGMLGNGVAVKDNERTDGSGTPLFSFSSVGRELQFLLSHTIHHYALIAMILRIQGFDPPKDFGVAPSTLEYRNRVREDFGSGAREV